MFQVSDYPLTSRPTIESGGSGGHGTRSATILRDCEVEDAERSAGPPGASTTLPIKSVGPDRLFGILLNGPERTVVFWVYRRGALVSPAISSRSEGLIVGTQSFLRGLNRLH